MREVTPHSSEVGDQSFSTAAELRLLSRGKEFLVILQVTVALIEGFLEAAVLTLFARLALRAVESESGYVYVPGLGNRTLGFGVAILVALILGRAVTGLLNAVLSSRFQFILMRLLRHNALDAYSSASWLSQTKLDDGAVQQFVVVVPNSVSGNLAGLITHVGHIVIMMAMLGYSMYTNPRLTALLVLVIIFSVLLFHPLRAVIKRLARNSLDRQKELSSGVAQYTSVQIEAQTFGLTMAAAAPLHLTIELDSDSSERLSRVKGSVVPLFTTITYLAVALCIVVLVNTDSGSLESTGPILLVVLRSLSYGTAIQHAAANIASLRPSLHFLRSQTNELRSSRIEWGNRQLTQFESCRFEGVTVRYPSVESSALREASFEISRGMHVGLVGPSGSGKSTVTRLILGLLQPQAGNILVNGESLYSYSRESWCRQVGVVPQTAQVIKGSIADNLRFYRDGISEADLWAALEIADLHGEIAAMPERLETVIGPGQRALSGGQQQRLAIARAFAGRPDFVVMDEPTSSVDIISEVAISDAVARVPSGVTVVIVSHRPKILERCDVLMTVEDGVITAFGNSAELLNSSPYLQSLAATSEM